MVYVTAVLKVGLQWVPGEVNEKCIHLIPFSVCLSGPCYHGNIENSVYSCARWDSRGHEDATELPKMTSLSTQHIMCVSMCVRVHTWKICHRTGTDTANQRRLPLRRQWPCRDRSSRRAFARAMPRLYWRARKAPRTALLGHHHHLLERGRGNRHRKLTKNRKTHPRHGDTNTYFVCTQLQV